MSDETFNPFDQPGWRALPRGVVVGKVDRRVRYINLSRLDDVEKRLVWECIKRSRPEVATWIENPLLQEMRERFNGAILIEA